MTNITFKQYRNIDLAILTLLTLVSEAIATLATNTIFGPQPLAISTTLLFISIVMLRWGAPAVIHAIVGAIVFCIASGASAEQYAIYIIGNLFSLIALVWFRAVGKEKIRTNPLLTVAFTASVYLLTQIGRSCVSLIFGGEIGVFAVYLGTDIISLLFAVVIMLLLRKTDGMIEDQKAYLFRLERERKEEENAQNFAGYGTED